MNLSYEIERLINYGLYKGLIKDCDIIYTRNRLIERLGIDDIEIAKPEDEFLESPAPILENIIKWALDSGKLENDGTTYTDLFDTGVMDCLMPRPSEVIERFNELYKSEPYEATKYFYKLSRDSNYIRTDRIKKDLRWKTPTEYGDMDITINLSKPEKDPETIAMAKSISQIEYPKCLLCKENEGYAGRLNHPSRQNHRIIPIELNKEKWFLQYSPYVYYNEHCIVLNREHVPMKISRGTFIRLLDFVDKFPHYFIGSNADLPIVGGSILTHDHFQGGNYEFPMAKAEVEKKYELKGFKDLAFGRVKWPMSVLRLEGDNKERLVEGAEYIREVWSNYTDSNADIISNTNGVPHNTITPIARMKNNRFQLDLVLRNNRISKEYPDGIFHPHKELHHIKKENIGLIEVMGLAVLPGRLSVELNELSKYLIKREKAYKTHDLSKHEKWFFELLSKYPDINSGNVFTIIKKEVGLKFLRVLMDSGVFKRNDIGNEAFDRFINSLN